LNIRACSAGLQLLASARKHGGTREQSVQQVFCFFLGFLFYLLHDMQVLDVSWNVVPAPQ
jgi:hypothetical protein